MEEKYIDIQYIRSEYNPADIMTKNSSEADFERHMTRMTEGELWELLYTGRDDVKRERVTDDVIACEKTEYSVHTLSEVVNGINING